MQPPKGWDFRESLSHKVPGATQRTGSYLADWAASRDRLAGLGNAAGAGYGLGPIVLVAQAYAANAHVTRYPDRPHGFELVSRALPGPCWPCVKHRSKQDGPKSEAQTPAHLAS